ncbi:MAG: hypothetical protein ACKVP7_17340 [Hyphomicrobiaceae bacterium]
MRQDEICRVSFEDFNAMQSTLMIRQRKHPRQKQSNDQAIPLVADTGYDAAALIIEQRERYGRGTGFLYCDIATHEHLARSRNVLGRDGQGSDPDEDRRRKDVVAADSARMPDARTPRYQGGYPFLVADNCMLTRTARFRPS